MAYEITTANSSLEFDTGNGTRNVAIMLDSSHIINRWMGVANDGFIQIFSVDTSTWAVTTSGARKEYDTTQGSIGSMILIDSNHIFNTYRRADTLVYVQVLTIDTSTYAITTNTPLDIHTESMSGGVPFAVQIDTNHFLCLFEDSYSGTIGQRLVVVAVDTSTWACSTSGATLQNGVSRASFQKGFKLDSTHFLVVWTEYLTIRGQIFTVNTSTWGITTASGYLDLGSFTTYVFEEKYFDFNQIDTNHFVIFYKATNDNAFAQVLTINTSTWGITTANNALTFDTTTGNRKDISIEKIDTNHFICFYNGSSYAMVQDFEVNTSTWEVTTKSANLSYDTSAIAQGNSCVKIDTSHYVNFWGGSGSDGYVQSFAVALPSVVTNFQINIGDTWKTVESIQINIGDSWKEVTNAQINIGDTWKTIY